MGGIRDDAPDALRCPAVVAMSVHSKVCWGRWALPLALALASAGCGGKSQGEGGARAPNGGAPNGGAGNAAGAPAAGAPNMGCPVTQPAQGSACTLAQFSSCSFPIDKCSSSTFECISGYWIEAPHTDGAAYDCNSFQPPNVPKDGDSCDCRGNLDCSYSDCSGRGQIHAVCDNTTWHVTESACVEHACGPNGLYCDAGSLCVTHVRRVAPQFECLANPCSSTVTSCDCAGLLCGPGEQCGVIAGDISCSCPTC